MLFSFGLFSLQHCAVILAVAKKTVPMPNIDLDVLRKAIQEEYKAVRASTA
jgi:hypothetical protein